MKELGFVLGMGLEEKVRLRKNGEKEEASSSKVWGRAELFLLTQEVLLAYNGLCSPLHLPRGQVIKTPKCSPGLLPPPLHICALHLGCSPAPLLPAYLTLSQIALLRGDSWDLQDQVESLIKASPLQPQSSLNCIASPAWHYSMSNFTFSVCISID